MPAIRIWHTTPLAAPRQCLVHTPPRPAACAISTAQDYRPNVWSNSSSGIGSASIPASCNSRSCPDSALRFAVWSNSSSDELINYNTAQRMVETVNKERQQNLGARGQGANSFKVGIPVADGVCFFALGNDVQQKITRQKIASRQCVRTARSNWKK